MLDELHTCLNKSVFMMIRCHTKNLITDVIRLIYGGSSITVGKKVYRHCVYPH